MSRVWFDAAMVLLSLLPLIPVTGRYIQGGRSRAALRQNLWLLMAGLGGVVFCAVAARAVTGSGSGWFSYWYPAAWVPAAVLSLGLFFSLPEPEAGEGEDSGELLPILAVLFAMIAAAGWCGRVMGALMALLGLAASYLVCIRYVRLSRKLRAAAVQSEQQRVLEKNLALQSQQYAALQEQIESAREARHDLRHHLSALWSYASDGDRSGLREYLEAWDPDGAAGLETPLAYCANASVNAVAAHYLSGAAKAGIRLDVALDIAQDAGVPSPDLCIIIGNALENAMTAAAAAPEAGRYVRARAETNENWIAIVVGNGFDGQPPERTGDDALMSHKARGRVGVGTQSIRSVAEKYGGAARFEAQDGRFMTSVILFRPDPDPADPAAPAAAAAK